MGHVHSAEERNVYYLDQLCTIGFCAALGVVQILLYHYRVLDLILVPKFHLPVLWSGIVLTSLAVLRSVALWSKAGMLAVHSHAHACCEEEGGQADDSAPHEHHEHHDHDHVHEHVHGDHCDHDHDHDHEPVPEVDDCGHSHGWAPWRYGVLTLPLLLFVMGMPWPAAASPADDVPDEPGVIVVSFQDLDSAADSDKDRKELQGKTVRIKAMFSPVGDPRKFQLYLLKMTCCFADAYPVMLKAGFLSPDPLPGEKLRGQWVYVTGKVEFVQPPGSKDYFTVVNLRTKDDVRPTTPASNPYLN
jgi:hypothetical protein